MTPGDRTRLKIWLVFVVVFALGCVTGAALDGLYRSRAGFDRHKEHGRGPEAHFETMRRDLNLNDEQAVAIRSILDETQNEYRALRAELRPRFDAPRLKARERIRGLLTPEQRQRFDAVVAQRDSMHDKRDKHER